LLFACFLGEGLVLMEALEPFWDCSSSPLSLSMGVEHLLSISSCDPYRSCEFYSFFSRSFCSRRKFW
jgi:hypothetical protein